jgi:hypothetical protein
MPSPTYETIVLVSLEIALQVCSHEVDKTAECRLRCRHQPLPLLWRQRGKDTKSKRPSLKADFDFETFLEILLFCSISCSPFFASKSLSRSVITLADRSGVRVEVCSCLSGVADTQAFRLCLSAFRSVEWSARNRGSTEQYMVQMITLVFNT